MGVIRFCFVEVTPQQNLLHFSSGFTISTGQKSDANGHPHVTDAFSYISRLNSNHCSLYNCVALWEPNKSPQQTFQNRQSFKYSSAEFQLAMDFADTSYCQTDFNNGKLQTRVYEFCKVKKLSLVFCYNNTCCSWLKVKHLELCDYIWQTVWNSTM